MVQHASLILSIRAIGYLNAKTHPYYSSRLSLALYILYSHGGERSLLSSLPVYRLILRSLHRSTASLHVCRLIFRIELLTLVTYPLVLIGTAYTYKKLTAQPVAA